MRVRKPLITWRRATILLLVPFGLVFLSALVTTPQSVMDEIDGAVREAERQRATPLNDRAELYERLRRLAMTDEERRAEWEALLRAESTPGDD